ncbi:MAG: hypothetical protein HFG49_06380 [Lachnospiraceae bacterium]|jgi:predicted ribosomally synthesized peptide with SipW-like signal peptide|nr:hypothetical protein [Lachnospiraceae bacterium]
MKKQIIAAAAAAMICAGAIGGTFAYLTSQTETVNNTFTVGNNVAFAENGGLDEAKVNELGEAEPGAERVTENQYKLLPGHEYTKDPTVHIKGGSEPCYVFVHVENGISEIEDESQTIAAQIAENWTAVDGKPGYYYWTAGVVTPETDDVDLEVFSKFSVKEDADYGALQEIVTEGKTIQITACLIQADGFTDANAAVSGLPGGFLASTAAE